VPAYVTAYEHFNEYRSILKMTTGSANLDSLIDSIQEGKFYLFYGSNKGVLDGLDSVIEKLEERQPVKRDDLRTMADHMDKLSTLEQRIRHRIEQTKNQIHESHNRAYIDSILIEIDTLDWVLNEIKILHRSNE
jgi:hypothetical protein